MPELPEVETIREKLEALVVGKAISAVNVFLPRQIVNMSAECFERGLKNRTIIAVKRRGKYLIMQLSENMNLIIHLRMTGRLIFSQEKTELPYCRVEFIFADGSRVYFCDTRTFGTLQLADDEELVKLKALSKLGVEPLSADFSRQYLLEMAGNSRKNIKSFLLDQSIIAGLGNIYVDESLFLSCIHPERAANSLSVEEINLLKNTIDAVISKAIEDKGTTFRDYRTVTGESGSNQNNLWVYGRRAEVCKKCNRLLSYKKVAGRGTHYCDCCQK